MNKARLLAIQKNRSRLQPQTFTRMLPNLATVMATCSGLSAIRFALLDNYQLATVAVIIAAILDAMDGRLARLLGAASDFGAELDSLSDFVSFGVAPAIILYILAMHKWRGVGWCICLFFAVCTSLRLARFNVMSRDPDKTAWPSQFFKGVPAPAGALIGLFPLILYLATGLSLFSSPILCGFFLCLSGALMISRLPTFSFKSVNIPNRWVPVVLVIVGLVVASLLNAPWETLSICVLFYLLSIPIGGVSFKKKMTAKDPIVKEKHQVIPISSSNL
jgi:CDP-diacylglycerol--serine O-phosphatidyltransferase